MMRSVVKTSILVLLFATSGWAQDPMPVLSATWQPVMQKEHQVEQPVSGPARMLTADDMLPQRKAREARTDHPENPSDLSPDGRRAALDKIEQQAATPTAKTIPGFKYALRVRNDGDKTAKVIYWEYQFAEVAAPANVVRRQFLCSVNLKKGGAIELIAFSTLGPTNVVTTETLAKPDEKRFAEKTLVNRIEYSDDTIIQRGNWKLADVKAAVGRATATPWGKEMCRPL